MEAPSQGPPSGGFGESISPEALKVNISAGNGSQVSAPMLVNSQIHGDVSINVFSDAQLNTNSVPEETVFDYKKSISSYFKRVQEYNSLPAEDVLLTDRYTELLMVQKHREEREKKNEISFRGASYFRAREAYQTTTVDQFFSPDDRGDVPKAVILQGHSGHGKSFTVQKIMLDWASYKLYQDQFELILHLRCKELNNMSGEQRVLDLVSCSQKYTALISHKLKVSPQKVLFLIDGFDELQFPIDETSGSPVADLVTPAPVNTILSGLLKGSILPDCFLLVTTRPTAADRLSKQLKRPQRSTETLGFSKKGVQEYFQNFYQNQQISEKAFSSVKANETLFTSCSIPVICWIVCTVFREQFEKDTEINDSLETTTSIFVHFVSTLLEHHCQVLGQPVPTLLRSLGQLAERGVLEQRVLFEKESVMSMVSDAGNVPFLCKFLLKKKVSQGEMFSFMHLSFQEFFTALYYTFDQNADKVKELLKSSQGDDTKSHLLPVVLFLFGLSNREVMQDLKHLKLLSSSSIRQQLEDWILGLIKENSESKKAQTTLFILHCLYELHEGKSNENQCEEKPFVTRAMEALGEMKFESIPLTRTDCWVLLYCLQCFQTIKSLNLEKCNITPEKLKMLQPALSRCEELGLHVQDLSNADVEDLMATLGEGKILPKLHIDNSSLSEESAEQVFGALCRQKSVGAALVSVKTITMTTAERILHLKNKHVAPFVGVCLAEMGGHGQEEMSPCSALMLGQEEDNFILMLSNCADVSPDSESSGLQLALSLTSAVSNTMLRPILHKFQPLRNTAENSPEYEESVDALMSHLSTLPDLKAVMLGTGCLTEIWANRILSLIHTCPSLREVKFVASICKSRFGEDEDGLLLKEGICLLQEAQRRPDCTISLKGKCCSRPVSPCRRLRDRKRGCNKVVTMEEKECPIKYVESTECTLTAEELREQRLKQSSCTQLKLTVTDLCDDDAGELVSALGEGQTLHSLCVASSTLSDEGVKQVLSALCGQTSLNEIHLVVNSITLNNAETLRLFFNSVHIGHFAMVSVDDQCEGAKDSLCSSIYLSRGEIYMLIVNHYRDPQAKRSRFSLVIGLSSEITDSTLREVLQKFHPLKGDQENGEHLSALFSSVASLPDLTYLNLLLDCLTIDWACRVLTIFKTHSSLERIKASVDILSVGAEDSLCSSVYLGRKNNIFTLKVNHCCDPKAKTSGFSLEIGLSSEITDSTLREVLLKFHPLKENLENGEHLNALFSSLASLPDLKFVELLLDCLTIDWASRILDFFKTHSSLERILVSVDILSVGAEEDSLCSSVYLGRENSISMLKANHCRDPKAKVSAFGLEIGLSSEITDSTLREVLQKFHPLKENPENGEHLNALFSSLASLPDLKSVDLLLDCLTIDWASRVLAFFRTHSSLESIAMTLAPDTAGAGSLCSGLIMGREGKYVRLTVAHFGESKTSGLEIILFVSSEITDTRQREILHKFHKLRCSPENSPEYEESVDALMSHLSTLPDLRAVILNTGCLTEIWANRILSLIYTCHSLKEVWFCAAVVHCNGEPDRGLLLNEVLKTLKEAQRRPDCGIRVAGLRCCKTTEPCTQLEDRKRGCNEVFRVSMKGQSYTENPPICNMETVLEAREKEEEKKKERDDMALVCSVVIVSLVVVTVSFIVSRRT